MKLDDFGEELDSDGGLLPIHELVLDVTGRDVGLAGAAVPDHHDLKHVTFIVHHLSIPAKNYKSLNPTTSTIHNSNEIACDTSLNRCFFPISFTLYYGNFSRILNHPNLTLSRLSSHRRAVHSRSCPRRTLLAGRRCFAVGRRLISVWILDGYFMEDVLVSISPDILL